MSVYKGSAKNGAIYHGSTKIEKVYKGATLVYSASEKNFVVKYYYKENFWAQGLLDGIIYKPNQQVFFGVIDSYPWLRNPFHTIKEITPTSLTDNYGNVYPAKRTVYIGDIPFIGWRRPDVQGYSGGYEILTAPNALVGDTALGGSIASLGGCSVVTADDGVTISFTSYNHQGGVYTTGSFQRSTSTSTFNYFYRG